MELGCLRRLAYRNYGFESRRRYGCLSLHNVVFMSGIGTCDDSITHPEESYEVWCVSVGVVEEPLGGSLGPQGLPNHDKKNRKVPDCSTDYNTIISYYRVLLPYFGHLPNHLYLRSFPPYKASTHHKVYSVKCC